MEISVSQNLVNFVSVLDTDRVLDILIIRKLLALQFSHLDHGGLTTWS